MRPYFNYAGLAPISETVRCAQREADERFAKKLFSEEGVNLYRTALMECRTAVAKLLNVPSAEGVAILPNASSGLNLVLNSVLVTSGQVVLTSDHEHPAVTIPLAAARKRGIRVIVVHATSPDAFLQGIRTLIQQEKVTLIIVSHVSYKDGRILPVEELGELAAAYDIPYLIDGAQAIGHIPIDLPRLRSWGYVFSGHKWLLGPMGTGGLWASAAFLAAYVGLWSSWAAQESNAVGAQFESGTMNFGLISGFWRAADEALHEGLQRQVMLTTLRDKILQYFKSLPSLTRLCWEGEHAAGILTYQVPAPFSPAVVAQILGESYGVVIKPFIETEYSQAIRLSYGPWTTEEEISQLAKGMAVLLR